MLSLAGFGGMIGQTPLLASFCLITGLAAVGFPGTIGFFGAEMLIEGAGDVAVELSVIVVVVAALNSIGVVQVYSKLFLGTPHPGNISLKCRSSERAAILLLLALVLGGGLYPRLAARWSIEAAASIAEQRETVRGR